MPARTGTRPPNAGKGRPKGSKNHAVAASKAFYAVFANLGGIEALTDWARESARNRKLFYVHIFPKLLAREYNVNIPQLTSFADDLRKAHERSERLRRDAEQQEQLRKDSPEVSQARPLPPDTVERRVLNG